MIVKIMPLWEGESLKGFRVSVSGTIFEVKQVFINDALEKEPSYTVRFVEAVDVHVNGEDEVVIYTGWCNE